MAAPIIVVLQQRDGKVHRMAREAVVAGQQLAAALDTTVEAVVLGSGLDAVREEVGGYGIERVHLADDPALADYTPGAYCGVLAEFLAGRESQWVLFPHTYQSVDYMARLAQQLGAGLLPEITGFSVEDGGIVWSRPVLGGKLQARVRARGDGAVLVSIQSGSYSADDLAAGQAEVVALAAAAPTADREILGIEEVGGDQVDLSQAERIVAVGRGVGGEDKMDVVHQLVEVLGAELAASRPVIDNGWLPRDRQIGSSGQTVTPKLYVAAGISGAIQHLVGMKGSQVVVAINKDSSAPIFSVADYGIVADLHEVLPELVQALSEISD